MSAENVPFASGDLVVYPSHGVGKITAIETQEIAGHTLSVFVVTFDKDRMTLRVPLGKAKASGLRKLSTQKEIEAALAKLRGRSRAKRTMWSRRAQEYQAKIASGDPASIAEVVRDLFRNSSQPEQSYSERQIYQAALDRLVREVAAVESIDEFTVTQGGEQLLSGWTRTPSRKAPQLPRRIFNPNRASYRRVTAIHQQVAAGNETRRVAGEK